MYALDWRDESKPFTRLQAEKHLSTFLLRREVRCLACLQDEVSVYRPSKLLYGIAFTVRLVILHS